MRCEECNKNEASVLISFVVNGKNTEKHLCQECMDTLKSSFASGNIESLLSSILSTMSKPDTKEEEKLACSRCGLDYKIFQKTGKLGCAQCYHDFREQLKPMLLRIHGRSQHSGRVPYENAKERERQDAIDDLRKQMAAAISEENFEEAAIIRDQLKVLCKEEEKA